MNEITPASLIALWDKQAREDKSAHPLWTDAEAEAKIVELVEQVAPDKSVSAESIMAAFACEHEMVVLAVLQRMLLQGKVVAVDLQKGGDKLSIDDFKFRLPEEPNV